MPASSSNRFARCSATSVNTSSTDIAAAHIVIDGGTVVLCDGDELVDVLKNGQGVLNVLSLGGVRDELEADLAPMSPAPIELDAHRATG